MELPLGLVPHQYSSPRINDSGFLDDETVPMKTGDIITRVVKRDLVYLVRVETYLALSAF